MSGFTAGPWTFEYENADYSGGGCWYSLKGPEGDNLFWYPYNGPRSGGAREEANARLAAAAPELLHACLLIAGNAPEVAAWLREYDPEAFKQVQAAIAKATQP